MIQLVLDPGVLIAGVIAPRGLCAQLLRRWLGGECELVVSPALLAELEEVLLRPKFRRYLDEEEARDFVQLVAATAQLVPDPPAQAGLTRDPDDDYLIALACAAGVDALVSGDPDLTSVPDPVPPIVTPRAILDRLDRARDGRLSAEAESANDEPSSPPWTLWLAMARLPDEAAWVQAAVRASRELAWREGSIDRCADCALLLPLDDSATPDGRLPCPRCRSMRRAHARTAVGWQRAVFDEIMDAPALPPARVVQLSVVCNGVSTVIATVITTIQPTPVPPPILCPIRIGGVTRAPGPQFLTMAQFRQNRRWNAARIAAASRATG